MQKNVASLHVIFVEFHHWTAWIRCGCQFNAIKSSFTRATFTTVLCFSVCKLSLKLSSRFDLLYIDGWTLWLSKIILQSFPLSIDRDIWSFADNFVFIHNFISSLFNPWLSFSVFCLPTAGSLNGMHLTKPALVFQKEKKQQQQLTFQLCNYMDALRNVESRHKHGWSEWKPIRKRWKKNELKLKRNKQLWRELKTKFDLIRSFVDHNKLFNESVSCFTPTHFL